MSIQGNLSAVKAGAIWGYAFDNAINKPVEVYLFLNGREVASTRADIFRQGVLDHGLHPTGNCGFTFALADHKLFLPEGATVQVKASNDRVELKSSPTIFTSENSPPILPPSPNTPKKRVLVVGLPKSGTSILTYRIAGGLSESHVCFEPNQEETLNDVAFHKKLTSDHSLLVTKCLFIPQTSHRLQLISPLYDKKIWLYRDLRDRIVSDFFYRWRSQYLKVSEERMKNMMKLLTQKERDPASVPFYRLMPKYSENHIAFLAKAVIEEDQKLDQTWFKVSYENFIQGQVEELNRYLGFEIDKEAEVANTYNMVARSKGKGGWRKWFTPEDVAFFRPIVNEYLMHFGYDQDNWELENPTSLPASEGSDYIKKIVSEVLIKAGKEIPPYLQ